MRRERTGELVVTSSVGGETVRAFVPDPLPPCPPVELIGELGEALDLALVSLGRLDAISTLLPDATLFLYSYIRKEAVLSSQIEGTQSSLSDLLLFELDAAPGALLDDVQEVSSYVAALEHGLARIRGGFPLASRLLREIHEILLAQGRGAERQPGEFRRSQNWIGGTRPGNAAFVPPPPDRVAGCMTALERFLNDQPERTSPLVKAALAHVQFETIHPFLDGNGRLGRLLVTLLLCGEGLLRDPLLYLSLHLKQNRQRYYELLQQVRDGGDWETWLMFFAEAVRETSEGAVETARTIADLFRTDRERIGGLGRAAGSALRVHHELQKRPLSTPSALCASARLTPPTVGRALAGLERLGIVREVTGRRRDRVFVYDRYLAVLAEGTEPTP